MRKLASAYYSQACVHPHDVLAGLDFEFDEMFHASSAQEGQSAESRTIDMTIYACGEDGFVLLMANYAGEKSTTRADWFGMRHFYTSTLLHKYLRDQQTKSPWGARVAADMIQLLVRSSILA